MIDGLKHAELILKILSDGKIHYSREFVDAGLLEYRRRITDLRRRRHIIHSLWVGKRPAYQMVIQTELKTDLFNHAA